MCSYYIENTMEISSERNEGLDGWDQLLDETEE